MKSLTRVKILTGFSEFGGSTFALIDLCNFLNLQGLQCTLYGPHSWHLDRCPAAMLDAYMPEDNDRLIVHYREVPHRLAARMCVLYCHEKHMFPIRERNVGGVDAIAFVSESQRRWHDVDGVVIPNLQPRIKYQHGITDTNAGVAGVIGTIHPGKRTRMAIERAVDAGYQRVLLYGNATEPYFTQEVRPLLSERVVHMGVEHDRRKMYDSISAVFHASESECACLVQQECNAFGVPFFGSEDIVAGPVWTDDEVLEAWRAILMIDADWIDQTHLGGNLGRQDSQYGWQTWFGRLIDASAVLDVGAGLGLSRPRIAGERNSVTLQDIAPGMPVDVSEPLDRIPSDSYDYVTAFDVIEHVPADKSFLLEMARVCRKGLLITTPNENHSHNVNPFHIREYTPAQLLELADTVGEARYFVGDGRGQEVLEMARASFRTHGWPHHGFLWRKNQ